QKRQRRQQYNDAAFHSGKLNRYSEERCRIPRRADPSNSALRSSQVHGSLSLFLLDSSWRLGAEFGLNIKRSVVVYPNQLPHFAAISESSSKKRRAAPPGNKPRPPRIYNDASLPDEPVGL